MPLLSLQARIRWVRALMHLSTAFSLLSFTLLSAGCGTCGFGLAASAAVLPGAQSGGPITITHGGTYTGHWSSDDWHTPAVQILTTQPVVIQNATITGRGDLISIASVGSGANVTVRDVTATALDPQVAGVQRGSFVVAQGVASLHVSNCTMSGVRFGVKVLDGTPTSLRINQNVATNLEDRTSDGKGGFQTSRPDLGHFVMLNGVSALNGAEIAWNQVIDTIGQSSTEDVINIYKSQGSLAAPISVHDNYMEGNSSPAVAQYTGAGLITDGDAEEPETAYVQFLRNQVVHTAGTGIEIAAGHDITANANRVVSCGVDSSGQWFAAPFANAVVVWNFYAEPGFSNLAVKGTQGGLLRPDSSGNPAVADLWTRTQDLNLTDQVASQAFTDPCMVNGTVNTGAEAAERSYWQSKLASNRISVGDPNTTP